LSAVRLVDYSVRILEETAGTASQVRVLIECSDGKENWRTVGSATNIIEASWLAPADSIEYWLAKQAGKAKGWLLLHIWGSYTKRLFKREGGNHCG
jgi:2-isopropylmalate synthase